MSPANRLGVFAVLTTLLLPGPVQGAKVHTVALKKAFVNDLKDRATINATFIVDHAGKPKPPKEDGDIHVAGRSEKVGLPLVAEVMKARQPGQKQIVDRLSADQGKDTPKPITGAWRFWFEHPGGDQVQSSTLLPKKPCVQPKCTNPDHVFEIHPVVSYDGVAVPRSLFKTEGYKYKTAADAFSNYNKRKISVAKFPGHIRLSSTQVGHNYAQFHLVLLGKPKLKGGGSIALANVVDEDEDGKFLAQRVRMIFLAGTPPAEAVATLGAGDGMHVIGIPRVNLHAVSKWAESSDGTPVTRALPYEMIIVAVLPE